MTLSNTISDKVSGLLANHTGSNYTVTKDKACTPAPGQKGTPLAVALTLCDSGAFTCEGIFDEKCDGTSVVVCAEIAPLEPYVTSAKPGSVTAGNVFKLTPVAVHYEMLTASVSSII